MAGALALILALDAGFPIPKICIFITLCSTRTVDQSLSTLKTSRCTPASLLTFWGCAISRTCPAGSLPGHPHQTKSMAKNTSLSSQHCRDLRSDAITWVWRILSLRFLFADLEDVKVSTDMVVAAHSPCLGCHAEPSLPRSSRIGPPHIHTKRCVF